MKVSEMYVLNVREHHLLTTGRVCLFMLALAVPLSTTIAQQTFNLDTPGLSFYAQTECEKEEDFCAPGVLSGGGTDTSELHVLAADLDGRVMFWQDYDDMSLGFADSDTKPDVIIVDTFSDEVVAPPGYELIGFNKSQLMIGSKSGRKTEWKSTDIINTLEGRTSDLEIVHNSLPVHKKVAMFVFSELSGKPVDEIEASIDSFSTGAEGYNAMAEMANADDNSIAFVIRQSQLSDETVSNTDLTVSPLMNAYGEPEIVRTAVFGHTADWSETLSVLRRLHDASTHVK